VTRRVESATRPERVRGAARRAEALRLRQGGRTFSEIGDALGISRQAAHAHVARALTDLADEQRDEARRLRALEAARLDALLAVVWEGAMRGEAWAWDRAMRVVVARARLLGLAPSAPLLSIALDSRPESPALRAARASLPPLTEVLRQAAEPSPPPAADGSPAKNGGRSSVHEGLSTP
jgi:hypothetical protein